MRIPRNARPWIAALALAVAAPSMADSLRCGSRLILEGDTAGKLRSLCGTPAAISRSSLQRAPAVWFNGRLVSVGFAPVEVPVETWEYNFGPNRLIHRVRLEDGLVVSIDTLGYGYP